MTAVGLLDDELTPLEDCRPSDELEVMDGLDVDDVEAIAPDDEAEAEVVPGIVAALTAPKTPTPATAASAAPTVSRLSRRTAASRACMRRSVLCVRSMGERFGPAAVPNVGNGL